MRSGSRGNSVTPPNDLTPNGEAEECRNRTRPRPSRARHAVNTRASTGCVRGAEVTVSRPRTPLPRTERPMSSATASEPAFGDDLTFTRQTPRAIGGTWVIGLLAGHRFQALVFP